MLYVHEVHRVAGSSERDFESAFRDGWGPALARSDGARLLWYLHHAHGTGPAYTVVTVTAVRDARAWAELVDRVTTGDLAALANDLDGLRHGHVAKALTPVPWSPLQDVDLTAVPVDPPDHEQALFMEDTAWPHPGRLDAYLERAGSLYLDTLRRAEEAGWGMLSLEAAFRPAFGAGRHAEVVLWQRVARPDLLVGLLAHDTPEEHTGPGTWMHDALEVRDRWESRLLRTARWSPLP